jgi:hypothetical protein
MAEFGLGLEPWHKGESSTLDTCKSQDPGAPEYLGERWSGLRLVLSPSHL